MGTKGQMALCFSQEVSYNFVYTALFAKFWNWTLTHLWTQYCLQHIVQLQWQVLSTAPLRGTELRQQKPILHRDMLGGEVLLCQAIGWQKLFEWSRCGWQCSLQVIQTVLGRIVTVVTEWNCGSYSLVMWVGSTGWRGNIWLIKEW